MDVLLPPGWAPPIGYANGIAATPGRIVLSRETPELGRTQVHFPRAGYVVGKA